MNKSSEVVVKAKASKSKTKVVASAVEAPDYRGIQIINRMGSVTINRNGRRLGRLSWLQGRDLTGAGDLIKIALAARIDMHKSSEAFTLSYNDNHGWLTSKP